MVDFAGWSMPVLYTSIATEHTATRTSIGLFDISHMGRLQFFGPDATRFLDAHLTRRVTDMRPGQIRYSLVCHDQGGILDDVLVYRLAGDGAADESPAFQVVVNSCNRAKIVQWLLERLPDFAARLDDVTNTTAMLAVQGPMAIKLLDPLVEHDLTAMRYYTSAETRLEGCHVLVSRTGYTGEDGCEIVCDVADALGIWQKIFDVGEDEEIDVRPVGLGARDTLRLEAAMPLYGHELSEEINPIQAGLGFAVTFGDRDFVGRAALERFSCDRNQPVRVGLQLDGRRVPRQDCPVLDGDQTIGNVTSGTFSPTFQRPIAMAYVRPAAQSVGTRLAVDVRGTAHAAVVVPLPFYERGKAGC
jgi:aminomethyltransferase